MDEFQQLLNRIRQKEHPQYGSINWDGQRREFEVSIQFTRSGVQEDDDIIRRRALRFLEELTPQEQETVNLDIIMRDGTPIRAVLKGDTKNLDPGRLEEIRRRAGL